jgi:hypothetical protein
MFVGPEFQFGHWYLAALTETSTSQEAHHVLAEIWRNMLLPQLLEHFAGRTEQLLAALGDPEDSPALSVGVPVPAWGALGATTLVTPGAGATDESVIKLLLNIGNLSA